MAEEVYLAVDMGASGGRVLAGLLNGRRLRLEEIHRFENGAIAAAGGLYWDVLGLWSHIVHGLRAAARNMVAGSEASASIPGAWILRCWDAATCCSRIPIRIATRGPMEC